MKIGIFDSGIGGLSVLRQAFLMLPEAEYIYYADEAHVPYGEKSGDQIRGYVEDIIAFFLEKEADAIVIACNTATASVTKEFRSNFKVPILGMEPAVKKAVELYGAGKGRILVAATPFTIAGNKLHHLLETVDVSNEVDLIALPQLVRFAQEQIFDSKEVEDYLRQTLSEYDLSHYEALVLGCTHFNYFIPVFRKVFPGKIQFIDGNEGTIRQLIRSLELKNDMNVTKKNYMSEKLESTEIYISGQLIDQTEKKRIATYFLQLEKACMNNSNY